MLSSNRFTFNRVWWKNLSYLAILPTTQLIKSAFLVISSHVNRHLFYITCGTQDWVISVVYMWHVYKVWNFLYILCKHSSNYAYTALMWLYSLHRPYRLACTNAGFLCCCMLIINCHSKQTRRGLWLRQIQLFNNLWEDCSENCLTVNMCSCSERSSPLKLTLSEVGSCSQTTASRYRHKLRIHWILCTASYSVS